MQIDRPVPAVHEGLPARPSLPTRLAAAFTRQQVPLSMLALLVWLTLTAFRLPGDACYDLANYHIYAPFALLHGKLGADLAPAQAQSYLPPLNDVPYYLLSRSIRSVRVLNVILVLPEVAALSLLLLITLRLTRAASVTERCIALVAIVLSATGAATHAVLATAMSDMVSCALILGAVLMLLRHEGELAGVRAGPVLLAGLLVGVALGLKLTLSYAAVGITAGLLCWTGLPAQARLRLAVLVSIGIVVGVVGCLGWWWARLYAFSGNPMFPLYNDLFRSPLAPAGDFVDRRFLPHSMLQALAYPFRWALHPDPVVTEADQQMRDPRIAMALLAALALLVLSVVTRTLVSGAVRFVAVLFLVGFVLWERQFSIFRYLSLLELLSGPMLAMLASVVLRSPAGRQATLNGAIIVLFLAMSWTVQPRWGRLAHSGGRPLVVSMPQLPARSLVLMLDASPLAFLAAYQPASVRFYGTSNNLTQPGSPTGLAGRIRDGIAAQLRDDPSDLWGIDRPDHHFGDADTVMAAYGLRRGDCRIITANIVYEPIRLCRLSR